MNGETTLTNPRAERVRAVRALAGRSARQRSGRFLVEGPQAVREAVRADHVHLRDVYVTAEAAQRYPEIVASADGRAVSVHVGTPEVLEAMSADAQGVLAVADLLTADLATVLAGRPRLVAVLAHVRDPGNAGAVVRTADAAGAGAVLLTDESVDLHNPKVVRSTAGSLFHVPVVTGVPLTRAVVALRQAGCTVLATAGSGAYDLDDLLDAAGRTDADLPGTGRAATNGIDPVPDLAAPTAWVFGNEAWGLRDDELALADAVARVPIHGRAESLNLATAAAVCLYASAHAQRSCGRA